MSEGLTKQRRQEIVRDFAVRHNGTFNPKLFLEEVRGTGSEHPAYGWFQWNLSAAALAYQIEQARDFARGLVVTFSVEEVGGKKAVKIAHREMPMVISPVDRRHDGGGYLLVDPENSEHMEEHCRQAAVALGSWLKRYGAALEHAGGAAKVIEEQISLLNATAPDEAKAA